MTDDQNITCVHAFNNCINTQDINGLAELMTDNHTFIDPAGHSVEGKEQVVQAWIGFFKAFPDYQNVFEHTTSTENKVIVTGHSTCSDERLAGKALWVAKVQNNQISQWQVFEDTPDIRAKLNI